MNSPKRNHDTAYVIAALAALTFAGFATDLAGFSLFAYAPPTPVSLRATEGFGGTDFIRVTWSPVNGATSYRVYRATEVNGSYSQVTSTVSTSYSDEVGCGNVVYFYKVSAVNGALESALTAGVQGSTGDCFSATACVDVSFQGPPVAIPDLSTTNSSINVVSAFEIDDIELSVAIQHTFIEDLVVTLVSPSGTRIDMVDRALGQGSVNFLDTTFSDSASGGIATGVAPYVGVFLPKDAFATLQGENSLGEWTLSIVDEAGGDFGALMAWRLSICPAEDGFQSADLNADNMFSLSELLRIIQLYNIGGYHCADNPGDTEDGYVPGAGINQSCTPHDTDYLPQDWVIVLSELLRAIQFYNSGGYNYCPGNGTEDGYCPGL